MSHPPVIFWLRRDLRLADNPALLAALKDGTFEALLKEDEEEEEKRREIDTAVDA